MSRLSVVSWNVHGGETIHGVKFDIGLELAARSPDLVALQEFPRLLAGSLDELTARAGLRYHAFWEVGSEDKTGLTVMSRWPLRNEKHLYARQPSRAVTDLDRDLVAYSKGALAVDVAFPETSLYFANVHLFPFHIFGLEDGSPEATEIWKDLAQEMMLGANPNTLVVGDFNGPAEFRLAPDVFRRYGMASSIVDGPTRTDGRSHDDLLFSDRFRALDVSVSMTASDHFLCEATLDSNGWIL